jgi:hypothetical protein
MNTADTIAHMTARATVKEIGHAVLLQSIPRTTRSPVTIRNVARWTIHLPSGWMFSVDLPANKDLAIERAAAIAAVVAL